MSAAPPQSDPDIPAPIAATDAVEYFARAVALKPDDYKLLIELGNALRNVGRNDEAIAALIKATELAPRNPRTHVNLSYAQRSAGRLTESIASYAKAVNLRPKDHAAHANLGIMLSDHGSFDEAIDAFRRALALKPNDAHAYSSLLFTLAHAQRQTPQEYLEIARGFERDVCGPIPPSPLSQKPIDLSQPIKLAFHSAEIGDHVVVHFLESYLRNYDRARFRIFLYSAKPRPGAKSAEMRGLVDEFRDIANLSDEDARRLIGADEIDILIDTTGHTARGRLQMLSHRCAPLQCHYVGFIATTGVSAIDYFIGDDEMAPPEFASHFTEKLIRLPKVWGAYTPPANGPDPQQESRDGAITVGSFNNLIKVHERTLDLWAAVLNAIPQANLLVKDWRCSDGVIRDRIAGHLARLGVAPQRITFHGRSGNWYDHMAMYNKLDIALDTTPFNSCTTGYDALYMSTPLIAMRSEWTGGRMSSSTLKALGRPEWIANSVEEYADIARRLAADLPRLKNFKKTLRAEMLASPLCDGKRLARDLEAAFLSMIADHNAKL